MRPYKGSRMVSPEEIIDKTSGYPTASLMFYREMVADLPDFYNNAPIADIPLQLLSANRGWAWYMDCLLYTSLFFLLQGFHHVGEQANRKQPGADGKVDSCLLYTSSAA